eukprot:5490868-Amphidinium_carterae.1
MTSRSFIVPELVSSVDLSYDTLVSLGEQLELWAGILGAGDFSHEGISFLECTSTDVMPCAGYLGHLCPCEQLCVRSEYRSPSPVRQQYKRVGWHGDSSFQILAVIVNGVFEMHGFRNWPSAVACMLKRSPSMGSCKDLELYTAGAWCRSSANWGDRGALF